MSLAHAILGVLRDRPLHGYAVRGALGERIGSFWPVNQGQVYATLHRLTRDGLVDTVAPAPDSPHRRYGLSPKGRRALEAWLLRPEAQRPVGFDDWLAHLAVAAGRHDRDLLLRTLEVQRRRCENLRRACGRGEPGLAERAAREILAAELDWLETAARELLGRTDGDA